MRRNSQTSWHVSRFSSPHWCLSLLTVLISLPSAWAQPRSGGDETELFRLDDLLNAQTKVASEKSRTLRETPAVVTLLTHEDLVASGARELSDVLIQVPGFMLATDVEGVLGLGFRGTWGQEGKILLLVDGQEFNEPLYGANEFGNDLPIEIIKSVEIIRGPGSAQYGGHAELAVINVTTLGGADYHGVQVTGTYGQTARTYARRNLTVAGGQVFANGADFSASVTAGQGNRSDQTYTDIYGTQYDMTGRNRLDPLFVNVGGGFHDLHARVIYEDYKTTNLDAFTNVLPTEAQKRFESLLTEVFYTWHLLPNLKLTPRFIFRQQTPWQEPRRSDAAEFFDVTARRYIGRLTMSYDITPALNASTGLELRYDQGFVNQRVAEAFYAQDIPTYRTVDAFGEISYDNPIVNFSAGARYENHSEFGNALVPRLALTKVINRFHAKLLYSRAFRTPDLMALAEAPGIKPETTTAFEGEVGYQLTGNMFATVNAFDYRIQDTITYFFDPAIGTVGREGYLNAGQAGSRGIELDYRIATSLVSLEATYSYYRSKNENSSYAVPGRSDVTLGLPAHKVAVNATVRPTNHLFVSPNAVFVSERFGATSQDATGNAVYTAEPATVLLNLCAGYRNVGIQGLDITAGVYNVFNTRFAYPQAYASFHAPLPGQPREFLIRVSYALGI